MIFIIGITIAFFLEFLILGKKQKSNADKVLAIWLLVMGLHLLLFYLVYSEKAYEYTFVLGLDIGLPFIHGPLLFLYISFLTNQAPKNNYLLALHFIPALLSYLYILHFLILPGADKIYVYENEGAGYESFLLINNIGIFTSAFAYVIWSLILLKRHRQNIKDVYSNVERINLNWLRYLIYGLGIIYFISLFFDEAYYTFAALTVFVLLIGYLGINQVGIFTNMENLPISSNINETKDESIEDPKATERYEKSGLSSSQSNEIYTQLTKLMDTKEFYKDNQISLPKLAKELKVHPNYLSQVINEKENCNFYTYINNLRINYFLSEFNKPENAHIKIISLAYEAGFNSKSSFNKYFKSVIGATPSAYRASKTASS